MSEALYHPWIDVAMRRGSRTCSYAGTLCARLSRNRSTLPTPPSQVAPCRTLSSSCLCAFTQGLPTLGNEVFSCMTDIWKSRFARGSH